MWIPGGDFSDDIWECWLQKLCRWWRRLGPGGVLPASEVPFIWSESRRISLEELLAISPFCLHSSGAWLIHWSVLLFYLLVESEGNRAPFRIITTPKRTFKIRLSCCLDTGETGDVSHGFADDNRAWAVGKAMLDIPALVVIKCRPWWIPALAPQNDRHSVSASSGWPLSLRGLTIFFFSGSKPFVFYVCYHDKRNWIMYYGLTIARKVTY